MSVRPLGAARHPSRSSANRRDLDICHSTGTPARRKAWRAARRPS